MKNFEKMLVSVAIGGLAYILLSHPRKTCEMIMILKREKKNEKEMPV